MAGWLAGWMDGWLQRLHAAGRSDGVKHTSFKRRPFLAFAWKANTKEATVVSPKHHLGSDFASHYYDFIFPS